MKEKRYSVESDGWTIMKHKEINWNDPLVKSLQKFLRGLDKAPLDVVKKVGTDKASKQFSINLPKTYALKARVKEDSDFVILYNQGMINSELAKKILNSKLIIYLKGEESGRKRRTKS